jgi:23S rRNA pseudouridine1911/1915/1917 synthase
MPARNFHLTAEHDGLSLGQALKRLLADQPWSHVRRLIERRQVQVNGNLCLDEARRVKAGDVLKLWDHPLAKPAEASDVKIIHLDEHLVVVNKPAGVTTLRHREEGDLPHRRKQLQPTLDELVAELLRGRELGGRELGGRGSRRAVGRQTAHRHGGRSLQRARVRPVHRLDRDTSGLMVFALTPEAERRLIRMFARHAVTRAYVAVVHGHALAQTIDTWLVRDRGDGLRGSAPLPLPLGEGRGEGAQHAVTHIRPLEHLPEYTILECRLETGRTHQIRIHLSEIGHMLCGEKTYTHPPGGRPREDASRAPRQALHAAELAFSHPITSQPMRFRVPLPRELKEWLLKLRQRV